MRYQHLAQIKAGCLLLGLIILPGCITTQPADPPLSLTCPVTPITAPASVSQEDQAPNNIKSQTTMSHVLQQRLQRTITAQAKRIETLSSQLEALKQIDQETRRQPRKSLLHPIP